jgi:hypothetical protein
MALYEINPNAMRGSGTFFKGRAGEALGRAKLVYKASDGRWNLADADAVATLPTLGITLDSARIAGQIVRVLKAGYIGQSTWTWTTGGRIYASTVAGELTQTPPAGVDDTIQRIGVASRTNMVFFDPQSGGGEGCAILEGASAYVGFDECKESYANYFLCDGTADDVQIQDALDYIDGLGGGTLHAELGVYDIISDINIPSTDQYIIQGEGRMKSTVSPTTSGGSVFSFSTGARFTATAGTRCTFRDMGFHVSGVQTDTWIDFFTTAPALAINLDSYNCGYSYQATCPAGSSTNPKGTPAGICIAWGRDSGPSGIPNIWDNNAFYDNRQGTNANNTLLGWKTESTVFKNNFFYLNIPAGLVTPNLIYAEGVSFIRFEANTIFTDDGMAGQYEHQYMCVGGNKNYYMQNEQLIAAADISGSNFTQHGAGTLHVYGSNLFQAEGGTSPIVPTGASTNAGIILFRIEGRGWENWGTATVANGTASLVVAHGLLGTPTLVTVTGAENHVEASQMAVDTAGAANFTIRFHGGGNVTADRDVYWYARYGFDVP